MNNKISIFTAVTVMSFMISSNSIPASAGVVCKSMVWGEAFSPSKPMARIKARMAWKANAGPGWNNTALAKQKSRVCRKEFQNHGHGAAKQKWRCVFKGRPCKKLGISGQ